MATPMGVREPSAAPARGRPRRRVWVTLGAAVAAAAAVSLVAVAVIDRGPDPPEGSLGRVDPATFFDANAAFVGGVAELWVSDWDGNLARYADGEWYRYPDAPSSHVSGIAVDEDGGVALATLYGLYRLDAGTWTPTVEVPAGRLTVAVDPSSGVQWWAGDEGVFRRDGTDVTRLPLPPTQLTSELAVTGDGSVWASGFGGYFPERGGLGRYHDDTGSWESVRPLGGLDDVPAFVLAATPSGDLWALLQDWDRDWEALQERGEQYVTWWLARFDTESQQWTVYEPDLGDQTPWAMVADDDAAWLAQGLSLPGAGVLDGVLRFDGHAWTSYAERDGSVRDIGLGDDGSVWVSFSDRVGVTRLDTGPDVGREADVPTDTLTPASDPDRPVVTGPEMDHEADVTTDTFMPAAVPVRLVVAVGDSLTGRWADQYAAAKGGDVVARTFTHGAGVDPAGLVDANADVLAVADVVFLEADPFPVFTACLADRSCRAAEIDAYRTRFSGVLDVLVAVRAGNSSGIAVVSMGFWAGDGLMGPDFYGSPEWSATIEDMQTWFTVVGQEAAARGVAVVDVNAELLGSDYRGPMPEGLTTDGIHFSAAGDEAVARILVAHDASS